MISDEALQAIRKSFKEAVSRNNGEVGLTHLLYGILCVKSIAEFLEVAEFDLESLVSAVRRALDNVPISSMKLIKQPEQTESYQRCIQKAGKYANSVGLGEIGVLPMLVSIFDEQGEDAVKILLDHGIDKEICLFEMAREAQAKNKSSSLTIKGMNSLSSGTKSLESPSKGELQKPELLSELGNDSRTLDLVGREGELFELYRILGRKNKNNAILLGEPGVGKTAIVYGLAKKVKNNEIKSLKGFKVYELDMGGLIAGTKFRGDFEERVKGVLDFLKSEGRVILYISEIHHISNSGQTSDNNIGMAGILKPVLTEGWLRLIGSTTYNEYRLSMEKDKALVRRFQNIIVDEPNFNETLEIVKGSIKGYEIYHKVEYDEDAIKAAVFLSGKYLTERYQPDKSLDLIDELGSDFRLKNKKLVKAKDVSKLIGVKLNIPPPDLRDKKDKKYLNLKLDLKKRVFGQNQAIDKIADALIVAKAGLKGDEKPAGSFLLTGPTGVGKTELAKSLAASLGVEFIRFDMSEYMESHSVSKLIGAPPGYIGYQEGGILTESIRKTPYAVLLLDEIEKAHPDVYNVLLQVMDRAVLTDNNGRQADFRNIILIMTSNVGSKEVSQKKIGFSGEEELMGDNSAAIKRVFSPEFIGRLDANITFRPLSQKVVASIVQRKIRELSGLLGKNKISIKIGQVAKKELARLGYSKVYGARPLIRIIEERIKKPLAVFILSGDLKEGSSIEISFKKGEFRFNSSQ